MMAVADVAVPVSNAREAAVWWQSKMGFAVHTVGPPGGHAIMVAPPGDRFVLHLCEGFEPVDPGNTGIAFMTDDIEDQVRRMRSGGVRFTEPFHKEAWGGMAKFADPDGNVFWLLGAPKEFIEEESRRRAPEADRAAPVTPPSKKRTRRGT
jgi:catechol 2,3-dioxygenase-like lactoylglutathione lyase family enzyme